MPALEFLTEAIQHLGLSTEEAYVTVQHYRAEAAQFAPCLFVDENGLTPDQLAYAEAVIVGAVERRLDMRRSVVTQSAGRQSETTRPAAAPKYDSARFTDSERAVLAALCAAGPVTLSPGPLGCFPAADDYSGLFARP